MIVIMLPLSGGQFHSAGTGDLRALVAEACFHTGLPFRPGPAGGTGGVVWGVSLKEAQQLREGDRSSAPCPGGGLLWGHALSSAGPFHAAVPSLPSTRFSLPLTFTWPVRYFFYSVESPHSGIYFWPDF